MRRDQEAEASVIAASVLSDSPVKISGNVDHTICNLGILYYGTHCSVFGNSGHFNIGSTFTISIDMRCLRRQDTSANSSQTKIVL